MNTNLKYTISIGLLMTIFIWSCESKKDDAMNNNQNQTQQFASSAEAVAKGKSDLLELLKKDKSNALNLDINTVENAVAEESIAIADIDFQRLMKADSITSLNDLANEAKGNITPLYNAYKLVTTISTRKDNGQWSVSGIKDHVVEAEINEIRNTNPAYKTSEIKLFEIPNIDAHVYSLSNGVSESYHSNYNGLSLSKPMDINPLLQILKRDALEFESKYGDQLKKGNLVK